MKRNLLLAPFVLLLIACAASAASPRLSVILPRGAQRGTEVVFTFSGQRLQDAQEILFYQPGVEITKIEPIEKNPNAVKVHAKIAADCRLGEHVCQVRCASGISDYRTFYIGALPDVQEKEPNTDFEAPQAIPLNVTVNGIAQNEDVDFFVIEAKKGQRISVEVEGMRLGTTMFDPYVAILDEKRFELIAVDDTALALQDPAASILAPQDGKYIIEVRESAYGGNGSSHYRLHVGTFPRPTAVYPAGGKLGEDIELKFLGDPSGEIVQKLKLPETAAAGFALFAQDSEGIATSANEFRLFAHGNVLEAEPNNSLQEATSAQLPLAFNGIIEKSDDHDWFKFTAKKGEVYEVECYARRIRSELDPVMHVFNAQGGAIAGDDDARGPDSYFRFQVPEDGEYAIRVIDHLGRGGPEFVYRVEFTPVSPSLTLGIPRVTRYGQERQQIVVPRGNRYATLVSANRANFGGELVLDGKDLPEGITMTAPPMASNLNVMPVLFEATTEAPVAGKLVDFTGRHADANQKISGRFQNKADFVISAPGQSLYRWCDVERLPIAVVEEVPFKIEIVQPSVPIVQRGSMNLKIVATRKEGFTAPITLEFPFRPPGISANPTAQIPEGQNEVLYTLNANGNAQAGKWPVYVFGYADVGGPAFASSQLATLEVAAPYVQFAMNRTAVPQGQETVLHTKIEHTTAFEGAAKVTLVGLPHKVTAPEMEITKETAELAFAVKTEGESPVGTHKNIFCQVVITQNGEPIVHNVGGTELRIDPPPPPMTEPPKTEPMPVAKKEEPKPPAAKPLTRLEQLRLEAQKRAEGGGE